MRSDLVIARAEVETLTLTQRQLAKDAKESADARDMLARMLAAKQPPHTDVHPGALLERSPRLPTWPTTAAVIAMLAFFALMMLTLRH